jgi:hypothetical protein
MNGVGFNIGPKTMCPAGSRRAGTGDNGADEGSGQRGVDKSGIFADIIPSFQFLQ